MLSTYGVELKLGDELALDFIGLVVYLESKLIPITGKNTIKSLAAAAMANASMKETSADIIEFAAA